MKKQWLRRALWPVTLGIIAYMFATIPVDRVWRTITSGEPWAVPALALAVVAVFLADVLAAWKTYSWFAAPLSFRETLVVRGAAYPLSLVNYAVGQGAFAYFLHKRRDVPLWRSAATVLLIMGINVLLLLFMTSGALALTGSFGARAEALATQVHAVELLLKLGYAGLAVYVVLVVWKPSFLARRELFSALLSAGLRGHAKALAVRVPHVLSLVGFAYLYLRGFGVDVPIKQAFLFLPVGFLVAAIPLPGQGFGAAQLIMVSIFSPYAAGDLETQRATVFGASLAGQIVATVVQLAIGLICFRSQLARAITAEPSPTTTAPSHL